MSCHLLCNAGTNHMLHLTTQANLSALPLILGRAKPPQGLFALYSHQVVLLLATLLVPRAMSGAGGWLSGLQAGPSGGTQVPLLHGG
jgi:hypothetical protein